MNFSVRLGAEHVAVDPGDSVPLAIEVTNAGPETDQFEIAVDGLDPEWTAVPTPSFSVHSGETHTEGIFFQPARASESLAASYPFTVRVRSLESGEVRTLPGVLQVKPFTHLTMELLPKKGVYSPMVRENVFQATVINLGNSEQELQMFGSDPDEALAYSFDPEHITIGPGQQKDVEVMAEPAHSRPIAGPRLFGFTISARSPDQPATACSSQAQLEQRPLLSPGYIAIFIAFLILFVGWLQFAPKKPVVDTFSTDVDAMTLKEGDRFTLRWQSSNAKSVKITFNSNEVISAGQPDGQQTFTATESGTFKIIAIRDSRVSEERDLQISVKEVIPEGPARIDEFRVDNRTVEPGETVMIYYKVTGAKKLALRPDGILLDATESSKRVTVPDNEGVIEYQLVASNGEDVKTESKVIRVTVKRQPKASITSFSADPTSVDPAVARATFTWQVSNAVRVDIMQGRDVAHTTTDKAGSVELDVFKSGDYTLVATGDDNLTVTKTIHITVKPTEAPADDTKTTGATGTTGTPPPANTTGGGTDSTTGSQSGGGRR